MTKDSIKKHFLLTVAIPTFNRASSLKMQLNNIHNILSKNDISQFIEVLVSDNCSIDDTGEVVDSIAKLAKTYKLTYNRNNSNIGSDLNFMTSILKSSGKFVWIMSDDDSLENNSIEYLYNSLLNNINNNIGFGFVNFFKDETKSSCAIPCSDEYMVTNNLDLLMPSLVESGMISSCVFRKSLFIEKNMREYVDSISGYPHMFWIADVVQQSQTIVIRKPLFTVIEQTVHERRKAARTREGYPFDFYLIAHLSYIKYISYIGKFDISLNSKIKLYKIIVTENLNQIIYHKITSEKYDKLAIREAFMTMVRKFYLSPTFWLLHVPTLILPSFLAKFIEPYRWKYIVLRSKLTSIIRKLI